MERNITQIDTSYIMGLFINSALSFYSFLRIQNTIKIMQDLVDTPTNKIAQKSRTRKTANAKMKYSIHLR